MGIRVNPESMKHQLEIRNATERLSLQFHKALMENKLPLSIGGGIGQSRLCMFLLKKAHIGEVQASIWPDDMRKECASLGMHLI
jgi:aspartate--ammonia ligase